MSKSLSILLVVLFSLSILATSFHHHNDFNDHPSCIYCKLAKDISSAEHSSSAVLAAPEPLVELFVQTAHEYLPLFSSTLVNPRAPPA